MTALPGDSSLPKGLGFWDSVCVPTVLQIDGLRVVVYLNDHRPAHVHVVGAEGEAVFYLNFRVSLRSFVRCTDSTGKRTVALQMR